MNWIYISNQSSTMGLNGKASWQRPSNHCVWKLRCWLILFQTLPTMIKHDIWSIILQYEIYSLLSNIHYKENIPVTPSQKSFSGKKYSHRRDQFSLKENTSVTNIKLILEKSNEGFFEKMLFYILNSIIYWLMHLNSKKNEIKINFLQLLFPHIFWFKIREIICMWCISVNS